MVWPRELPMHGIDPNHPMWYRWVKYGKIKWVHKAKEAYQKVIEKLMGGK